MDQQVILYVVGLILMGGLLYWLGRRQPAHSPAEVAEQMVRAANVALDLVQAAEQLWLTGELPKDDRLRYVLDELEAIFPDLDERQLRATVESAVFWMKFGIQKFGELDVAAPGIVLTGGERLREVGHRGPEN